MDSQIAVQIPTILPKQSISLNFMPLNEMYKITTKSDNNWGIAGYQVPKRYFDHIKTIQDRIFEEMRVKGKFEKSMKKVTKRGCYLDDEFKLHKITPGPQKYDVSYKWSNPAEIESGKKNLKIQRKILILMKQQIIQNEIQFQEQENII
ncbi:hypothetical protein IMG5_116390 [Ichthyophthirius multifiliis]|uniref:Uncharacterized protein n=1 Tax=Ichthyophthirius multifiliis TaxID=5932 RepID=G0QUD1_ICHMU|nr:hypothetical protein IMG5_116390 [Ichthyophthirius multifiliis]EGR31168.1 hypothetical protein IMG5_116390 [Ichthyophthirius multifiliis]|eukprot:XP_004034654.1 hypothetical protein IMG5_116390 [Ichthyophthirius multifiliis]